MTTLLPKPEVSVDLSPSPDGSRQGATIGITRGGKGRSYVGEGSTQTEAVKDVVEKIIGDRHTGEFLP